MDYHINSWSVWEFSSGNFQSQIPVESPEQKSIHGLPDPGDSGSSELVDVDALWRLFVLIHPPQMVQA
jgi:hypothetical protein